MALPSLIDAVEMFVFVAWGGILGVTVVRYRRKAIRRTKAYGLGAVSVLWLAYSLFQLSEQVAGVTAPAVQLVGLVVFLAGLAIGVLWWQIRSAESTTAASN
ncbi:hypothetical protein SAMN04487950_3924 [Halogranum rubrum]|uniref:Uncharacterized protein n=1 Tax=Halogranum rubrum TaxID=553466 RepID=A0A1I4I2G0_9EURY|nr:hypothetical protein [Halogranum rubrum]SFL48632.1 hypothetical protein SAMN04487950_3924 [Halogranum rubrum]